MNRKLKLYFQANKIIGCEIVRQRDLPFDFIMGACNTFQAPQDPGKESGE